MPTISEWIELSGTVTQGHRIASGEAAHSPYGTGSLALQIPHFAAQGLDLSGYHPATLNVALDVSAVHLRQPAHTFRGVRWTDRVPPEDFSFAPCQLRHAAHTYEGWVYSPHPETKPDHHQAANVLEVITGFIPGIRYGSAVTLSVHRGTLAIEP